jgi:hypothetical protein
MDQGTVERDATLQGVLGTLASVMIYMAIFGHPLSMVCWGISKLTYWQSTLL